MNRFRHLALSIGVILIPLQSVISQTGVSPVCTLHGAVVRGDSSKPELALVFTGDEYADGAIQIKNVLNQQDVKASFFLTGKFYRNPDFGPAIESLKSGGHYMGAHSDQHLLYCDWENRDSLLVTQEEFTADLEQNYHTMLKYGINREDALYFLPPYEWYNDSIAHWCGSMGLQLVNMTYGTLSHADYTVPGSEGYHSSSDIYQSILDFELSSPQGLNGFILLIHIGTAEERTDKFYFYLEKLLMELKSKGYQFKRIDELLDHIKH